jgi:uncharacterized membrane protein affecting hemolysin expression
VQKQKFNIYTMMLILSFFAIVTACILLYVELTRYGSSPWWDTKSIATPPATSMLLEPPLPIAAPRML